MVYIGDTTVYSSLRQGKHQHDHDQPQGDTMNTLHVEPAKTETTPGEFVTDGFRVVPVTDGVKGDAIYQSRFANKAMTKAFVLLGSEKYAGWAVTVESSEVTDVAGKLNLEMLADADRFKAIRALAMTEVPTDEIVAGMKAHDAQS